MFYPYQGREDFGCNTRSSTPPHVLEVRVGTLFSSCLHCVVQLDSYTIYDVFLLTSLSLPLLPTKSIPPVSSEESPHFEHDFGLPILHDGPLPRKNHLFFRVTIFIQDLPPLFLFSNHNFVFPSVTRFCFSSWILT